MKYEEIKDRTNKDFRRLTGVGHQTKLSRADQSLMTLMYWREYRTQFRIAQAFGVSESAVCRTIQKIEEALINSGQFGLLGKKALHPSDTIIEIVVVDATEQPIERPKKNNVDTTAIRRNDTLRKPK